MAKRKDSYKWYIHEQYSGKYVGVADTQEEARAKAVKYSRKHGGVPVYVQSRRSNPLSLSLPRNKWVNAKVQVTSSGKVLAKVDEDVLSRIGKMFNGKRRRRSNPDQYAGETIYLSRIPLNRQGYTRGKYPQYYGTGAPLFSYELYNEGTIREMRASSRSEARAILKQKYPGAKIK